MHELERAAALFLLSSAALGAHAASRDDSTQPSATTPRRAVFALLGVGLGALGAKAVMGRRKDD